MRLNNLAKIFVLVVLGLSIVQCGEESLSGRLSKLITITPVPEIPLVINADITLDKGGENEVTYKAPWTRFQFRIKNESGQKFKILTFTFYITSSKSGAIVKKEGGFDMGSQTGSAYGEFEKDYDATKDIVLYLDALPKADGFVYNVEFEAQGYFLNSKGEPSNRLNVSTFMITQ